MSFIRHNHANVCIYYYLIIMIRGGGLEDILGLEDVRTVLKSLALASKDQVLGLGLEPSKSSKIGPSSVEDCSFLLSFKSYISLKLF